MMTIDVTALRERLQAHAASATELLDEQGFENDRAFLNGRKTAFERALALLDEAENEAATERDEAFGEGVDLAAVGRLEAFSRGEDVYGDYATETGALDQASGTVYSDADGGL